MSERYPRRNQIEPIDTLESDVVALTGDESEPPPSQHTRSGPGPENDPSNSRSVATMPRPIKNARPKLDLETEAQSALEAAHSLAPGPERTEAMKRAGVLQNAADMQSLLFAKRGRPPKT
jgi:hypothetical protein